MIEPTSLIAALMLGFFGSSHCLVMCGGISAAVNTARTNNCQSGRNTSSLKKTLAFNSGRILSYGIIGSALSLIGLVAIELHHNSLLMLRTLAGILLIAMGLYVGRYSFMLTRFETLGQPLWRRLQPLIQTLIKSPSTLSVFCLGLLWGLLPCGLIYSTLVWASTTASPMSSGLLMVVFGIGTLPSMLAAGLMGQQLIVLLKSNMLRYVSSMLLIVYGVWTLVMPWHAVIH